MLTSVSFRVWQSAPAQGSHRQAQRHKGIQAGLEAHETVPPVGNELAATPSLFCPRFGSLNRLLYKPGKLFIRAELKGGGRCAGGAFSLTGMTAEKCEEQTSQSICSTE